MEKRKKPPRWQEGRREFDVVIPADRSKSGEEETVRVGYSWKVIAGRPMTARDRTRWEMDRAREMLDRACNALQDGKESKVGAADDFDSALTHAIRAWCRTHLRCKDASSDNQSYHEAFDDKAPGELRDAISAAWRAYRRLGTQRTSRDEVAAAMQGAVDALLEAASRPPRSRRRFPAHLRTGRLLKPRVRPGSWIDTGRYRPAVVLDMMPDPPHRMKLCYGDETADFLPHIARWRSVRRRKRAPSLKDVFSPGDWIRHPFNGCGRVITVRNSTLDVKFGDRHGTYVPEADLSRWKKPHVREFGDDRPVVDRLPPGTWIESLGSGEGVILTIEDGLLVALFRHGVERMAEPDIGNEEPVMWKLIGEGGFAVNSRWGRRWAWWWLNRDIHDEPVCACCGYPNFGSGRGNRVEAKECIICGYPYFGDPFEYGPGAHVLRKDGRWQHRMDGRWLHHDAWRCLSPEEQTLPPDYAYEHEWNESGYSLWEARRNWENRGVMLRADEPNAMPSKTLAFLRRALIRLLEKRMAEPAEWSDDDGQVVERVKRKILSELTKVRAESHGVEQT